MATIRSIDVRISANSASYIGALKKAETATRQFNSAVSSSSGTIANNTRSARTASANLNNMARGGNAALNTFQRLGGAVTAGSRAFGSAGQQVGFMNKGLAAMKSVAISAVSALVGFTAIHIAITLARKAVSFMKEAILDFNKAMVESTAIMGDLDKQTRTNLENAALNVSKITSFTPTEAAKGLYYLASAGYDANFSMKMMPTTAKFAQAGVMDLAKATEYLVDIQRAMNGKGKAQLYDPTDIKKTEEGAKRVADVIVRTAVTSNATVEQVSQALTGKMAPQIRAVNKDIEEAAAMVGVFASQGIKGATASTQIAAALRDLQSKAVKNAGTFQSFGLEIFDSQGKMKNMADIIGQLEVVLGGMSDEQKRATLLQLGFQDRSVSAILTMVGYSDQLRTMQKDLHNAGGTLEEISQKQLQSFKGQMQLASNAIYRFSIQAGRLATVGIGKIVKILTPAFNETTKAVKKVWEAFKPFATLVAKAVGATIIAGFTVLGKVIEVAAKAAQKFSGVIAALLMYFTTKNIIMPFFGSILNGFKVAALSASSFFKGFVAQSQNVNILPIGARTLPQYMQNAAAAGQRFFQTMSPIFNFLNKGFSFTSGIFSNITTSIKNLASQGGAVFKSFIGSIGSSISSMRTIIGSGISSLISGFGNMITSIKNTAISFMSMTKSFMKNPFMSLGAMLSTIDMKFLAFKLRLATFGQGFIQFVKNPITSITSVFSGLGSRLSAIGASFVSFGNTIKSAFMGAMTSSWSAVKSIGASLLSFGSSLISGGMQAASFSIKSIASFLSVNFGAKAMASAVSLAASTISFGLQAALIIIPMLTMGFQNAQQKAAEMVSSMTQSFDKLTIGGNVDEIDLLNQKLVGLRKEYAKHEEASMIGEMLNPFHANEKVDALHAVQEAELEAAKASERFTNISANATYVNKENNDSLMLAGESWDHYRTRVSEAAAKAGIDLGQLPEDSKAAREKIAVILRKQTNDLNNAGQGFADLATASEEEMQAVADSVDEQSKNVSKNIADLFDPSKAYEEAKSFTEAINKAFTTPDKVFSDYKSNLEKQAKDAFDAAQKVAEKEAKKNKKDYTAPDFTFNANIGAKEFLKILQGQGKLVDAYRERMRKLVALGASPEFIAGLQQLGDDALPIMQEITSMSEQEARNTVEGYNKEYAKFGDIPEVDLGIFAKKMAERKQNALDSVQAGLDLISMGFAPEQIRTMMADPDMMQAMVQMWKELKMTPSGDARNQKILEFHKLTQDVYDAKNIETTGITKAMEGAMAAAYEVAKTGSQSIVDVISQQLGLTPLAVYKMFSDLEKLGIDVPGFNPATEPVPSANEPVGGAKPPTPGAAPAPNAPTAGQQTPKVKYKGNKQIGTMIWFGGGPKNGQQVPRFTIPLGWRTGGAPSSLYKKKGDPWFDNLNGMHVIGQYANGGIEQHNAQIAKNGMRVWAEPETGGEAYIPLAVSKRSRSAQILENVAKQFGYGLVKYANGGFYGTAGSQMIGAGHYGTHHAQTTQTIIVPVQSKNETNFNGPIVGVNMEDAMRFADQKRRQRALTR